MSYNNGPRIVTDGLVLLLDAGNNKSYSGTGTTWTDLSGNNNNGTLTNGPTYNSSNKGSIVFDGTNDYIRLPNNFFSYPSLTTLSISLWFKSTQTTGGTLFGQQNTNNPNVTSGYVPVIYLTSLGYVRLEMFWTGSINNSIISSNLSPYNNNIWHNIVATYSSGTQTLYVDGIYIGQQSGITLTNYTSIYYYFIGAGWPAGRGLGSTYFNGNISNFCFYNQALSNIQINQNYNALKGRYNL